MNNKIPSTVKAPLVEVTRERRYGPSRLRVNDDDDDVKVLLGSAVANVGLCDAAADDDDGIILVHFACLIAEQCR